MEKFFVAFANGTAKVAGKPWTFIACVGVVLLWAVAGPAFDYSQTWQLVINTGTTIITFLMVFLIQNTQNRDGAALQAKLDELLHAVRNADERFIGIERLTDKELSLILKQVEARAITIQGEGPPIVATREQDRLRAERRNAKAVSAAAAKDKPETPRSSTRRAARA